MGNSTTNHHKLTRQDIKLVTRQCSHDTLTRQILKNLGSISFRISNTLRSPYSMVLEKQLLTRRNNHTRQPKIHFRSYSLKTVRPYSTDLKTYSTKIILWLTRQKYLHLTRQKTPWVLLDKKPLFHTRQNVDVNSTKMICFLLDKIESYSKNLIKSIIDKNR